MPGEGLPEAASGAPVTGTPVTGAPVSARVEPRHEAAFRVALPAWFDCAQRAMPWRATDAAGRRDPYRVWLAETMLQQTRVDTATPYFERFAAEFPTVTELALASLDRVLVLWEGLGYYSRARNLHRAAQQVVAEHGGRVPATAAAFGALPGVGPYTTAAVLSLAYDVPLAVLDGNVIRVLARVFAIPDDSKSPRTRAALQALATRLLDVARPGRWNEAVMEVGATVCTPRKPACGVCPLSPVCAARALGTPEAFPVVRPRRAVPQATVAVALLTDAAGRVLMQRRPEHVMLGGLWEFPGGKVEPGETPAAACAREVREELGVEAHVGREVAVVVHTYSHLRVRLHAFRCRIVSGEPATVTGEPMRWLGPDELDAVAVPRASRKILDTVRAEAQAPRLF